MNRILVIRGGAIGDFVLTLPAIKLLRDRFPSAHVEILGHKPIIALAQKRFYADATRSIEERPLAGFFQKDAALPTELIAYFGSFDLIVSYLFDPDGIFQANLTRCRIKLLIAGPSKLSGDDHAAIQLARPWNRSAYICKIPRRGFIQAKGIASSRGVLSAIRANLSSRFIRGAEAKRKIGRSRTGRNLANISSRLIARFL